MFEAQLREVASFPILVPELLRTVLIKVYVIPLNVSLMMFFC